MDTKENQKLLETFVFLCDLRVLCVKKFARIENPLATLLRHPPVGAGRARERCVPGTKSRAWPAPTGERQMCITIWALARDAAVPQRALHRGLKPPPTSKLSNVTD